VERRTVVVPRDRPLAGAGRDRRAAAGSALRLDGRASRPALGKRSRLRYRWQVVVKPQGSKVKLRGASSPRPRLRADKPGLYRVQLLVSEPRRVGGRQVQRSASDVVTLTSVPNLPPIGQTVETMAANGKSGAEADTGIRIGPKTYWLGRPQGNDFQVVILERTTLAPLYAASIGSDPDDLVKLEEALKAAGSEGLVLISNPALPGGDPENQYAVELAERIGVRIAPIKSGREGWSAIGTFHAKNGGYLGAGSNSNPQGGLELRGNLSGYLQLTSGGAFAFNPGSRVAFDTSAPGSGFRNNTIKVGSAEYEVNFPDCSNGGFQVQVLLAETLAPAAESLPFITSSGGNCGQYDEAEQKRMAEYLNSITTGGGPGIEGPKLVIVQSLGNPYDSGSESWNLIASALAKLGGSPTVFAEARSSYTLVGGVGVYHLPLTEASQTLTGKAARITGLLKPERQGTYAPLLSSPTGGTSFQLSSIAYQPSQPWPASQEAGEKKALQYIAEKVLKLEAPTLGKSCYVPARPDVRSQYCNEEYRFEWSSWVGTLERAEFKSGEGFGKSEWEAVTKQLYEKEFRTVQRIWNFTAEIQQVFGVAAGKNQVDLNGIASEIKKALTPPQTSEAVGWWLELFGNFASTGSYFSWGIEGENVQKTLGVIQGALFETAASIYGPTGEPLLDEFQVSVNDLAEDLGGRFVDASIAVGSLGEILVSDWGKLRAIQESGLLGFNNKGYAKSLEALKYGTEQWSWQKLMPAAYEAIKIEPGSLNEPLPEHAGAYRCVYKFGRDYPEYNPFGGTPEGAELKIAQAPESIGVLVIKGSRLPSGGSLEAHYPKTPTQKLMETLLNSEAKGGVGLYKPWFFRDAFDYPAKGTRTVSC